MKTFATCDTKVIGLSHSLNCGTPNLLMEKKRVVSVAVSRKRKFAIDAIKLIFNGIFSS